MSSERDPRRVLWIMIRTLASTVRKMRETNLSKKRNDRITAGLRIDCDYRG